MKPTVDLVAGARPNFMKLAPVVWAISGSDGLGYRIIHTGQHYSESMNGVFFRELGIPMPDIHLEVGSGTHAAQTARILERYESHLLQNRPDATVVFGDVNSTLACALAAVKLGIPVVHVEAGLRSFDRTMPEEINRLMTDAIADLLLVSESSGLKNLQREGIPDEKVRLVGNVMIDTLLRQLESAKSLRKSVSLGQANGSYAFLTLHRPSNVDQPETLGPLLQTFHEISKEIPIIFPVHPRTIAAAGRMGFGNLLARGQKRFICLEPLPYHETISLVAGAKFVLTDSGGLQEETSVLNIPCLTLRENTERPVTTELGTSRLVGNDPGRIMESYKEIMNMKWPSAKIIPFWDGKTGERIVSEISTFLDT